MNESYSPQLPPIDPPTWPPIKPPLTISHALPGAGFETICAHYAEDAQDRHGAAAPALYQTSTFIYPDAEAFELRRTPASRHHDYSRISNPTTQILETKLARLEQAEWCDVFGSGMGAISAAINACVKSGSHVVAIGHVYGPTRMYLDHIRRLNVETTYVNAEEVSDFVAAIRPNTTLIYLESPTSGCFDVPDMHGICAEARRRGIPTITDNSWASPYFANPLEWGVDLVTHSATKYINGHSDVVAGCVMGRDRALRDRLWREAELIGAMLDPFAAWLMLRGLRTLALRMERHQENGLKVARFLESHASVARVIHPGLPSHPQHERARRQFRGYSGLFTFALKDPSQAAIRRLLDRVHLFQIGVSWGGFESLILGGDFFTRPPRPKEHLIRVSVGLESANDLIADLDKALE